MKIRSDIVDMLRDGLTDTQIARHAHVATKTVAAARAALGLPKCKPGQKRQASLDKAFRDRTQAAEDGHLEWTGGRISNKPGACGVFRFDGRRYTAYRAAFLLHHGRPPVGDARPGCGRPGCVAPEHMDDRPARERNRAAFTALFGGLS